MSSDLYPLLMFVLLFVLLAVGVPIAFSLAAVSIVFAYFLWGWGALNLLVSATWGSMNNFVIVAVPLFIYMAYILQKLMSSQTSMTLFSSGPAGCAAAWRSRRSS